MNGLYQEIAEVIRQADALLIGAGAGMGVDSGLPDFRGDEGFWKAYPPMKELGLSFYDLANPRWFKDDPQRAWGFYGHRRNLYRETQPHPGFEILKKWSGRMKHGAFVFTSNVDGHFQKSEFHDERIVECHGSIEFVQCTRPCCDEIWRAAETAIEVDLGRFRAGTELPECHFCSAVARPNILMFGDWNWIESRTSQQFQNFKNWLNSVGSSKLVIIEIGAGTAVPSVRNQCEHIARQQNGLLIRVNPREADGPCDFAMETGGLRAITEINLLIDQSG